MTVSEILEWQDAIRLEKMACMFGCDHDGDSRKAVLEERERCAKLVEEYRGDKILADMIRSGRPLDI